METEVLRSKFFTLVTPESQAKQEKEARKKASSQVELPSVFYEGVDHYLDYSKSTNQIEGRTRLDFPINIDTEFQSKPKHWSESFEKIGSEVVERSNRQSTRVHITTQMRGIHQNQGVIFASRECEAVIKRHKTLKTGFDPIDYLQHLGYDCELSRIDLAKCDRNLKKSFQSLPEFRVVMFAHFATAECMLIVRDGYWQDFEMLMATPDPKNPPGKPRFSLKRNLKAITETISYKNGKLIIHNYVDLPWLLKLNDRQFRITVEWVDTCALHGIGSYKAICDSARVPIPYKANFSQSEKERMLEQAVDDSDRANDFDNYALGDLYVYDALVGNADNFRKVYQALDIEHLYKHPALTIGATVKNLFEAKLCAELGVNYLVRDELNYLRDNFLSPVSAKVLRQNPGLTRCLAAKVEGGRCRSNRPTDINVESLLVDIDVAGCYAEGLRYQPYPIGNPRILDFRAENRSEYWNLAKFRKIHGSKLVRGLWVARVWTKERLEYSQDFLASWFVTTVGDDLLSMAKYIQAMASDSEKQNQDESPEFDLDDGHLKIFNCEVINGVITHDFLDWLDCVATPRQRKEIENNLLIKVAVFYPKNTEIQGSDNREKYRALVKASQEHSDKDTVEVIRRKGVEKDASIDGQYHGWFSVNLGVLIVDDLLMWRKHYQDKDGKKSPMDSVFKLCNNTLYGDMTSKYFDSANVVVGNNVTARARAMVWYVEKGLHTMQIVTDGGAFELNRVVYPNTKSRRVSGENTVNLYTCDEREARIERQIKFAPLGGCESIAIEWADNPKFEQECETVIAENNIKNHVFVLKELEKWVLVADDDREFELKSVPKNPHLVLTQNGETKKLSPSESEKWVNDTAWKHLQTLFPKVDVLHAASKKLASEPGVNGIPRKVFSDRIGLFGFEMKAFYDRGAFHGSANYVLHNPNSINLKMRSYETKNPHESVAGALAVDLQTKVQTIHPYICDRYSAENTPSYDFMMGLLKGDPTYRQVPFVKDRILKPSDYKDRLGKYRALGIVPGDNLNVAGLLREFSLSQFTFPTMAQFVAWDKKITAMKNKFGQSVERYFIVNNPITGKDQVDNEAMVRTIDKLIRDEVINPIESLDPNRNNARMDKIEHPELGTFLSVKSLLGLSNDD